MTANEKLNTVLEYLLKEEIKGAALKSMQLELLGKDKSLTEYELYVILNKLVKDEYVTHVISIDLPEYDIKQNPVYVLTFEGKTYTENGGYVQEQKDKEFIQKLNEQYSSASRRNDEILAQGTVVLAVGTLLLVLIEVVRFYHDLHIHCH